MSESKASQSYQAFDSIRQRFGGAEPTQPPQQQPQQPQQQRQTSSGGWQQWNREKAKRRFDSRVSATASPLLPLVEESDQLQAEIAGAAADANPQQYLHTVKGKWRHSSVPRSNHLNGPDFDALETASTTSCSSAYSSRSESSALTGSVSELLSDAGSCDTYQEYDIKQGHQSRTAQLRASFEVTVSSPNAKFGELEPPDDHVKVKTKSWNKVIGEWIFPGISKLSSPSQNRAELRPPSNEIRVPTPLSTPVHGSTENLLDSGSHVSLVSSNGEGSEASEDCYWMPQKQYKMGKFILNAPSNRARRLSTSSLTSESRRMNDELYRKRSDSCVPDNTCLDYDAEGLTPKDEGVSEVPEARESTTHTQHKWAKPEKKFDNLEPPCDDYSAKIAEKWLKAFNKPHSPALQKEDNTITSSPQDNNPPPAMPLGDNRPTNPRKMAPTKPLRSEEEPVYSSIVEQRASVFGGTKTKRGLRRTQSFQVGPRNHGNDNAGSPLANMRRSPHILVKRPAPQFV